MQIEYRNINELKPYEHNPRRIAKEQFEKLKASLEKDPEFFEARPLLLSDRTGELVIIGGNQRYRAAKSLGLKSVPTITLHCETEEEEKRRVIQDNNSAGYWDTDELANGWDLSELRDLGLEFDESEFKQKIDDEIQEIQDDDGYFGDERERTYEMTNFDLYDEYRASGKYNIPTLESYVGEVPDELIGFNYMLSSKPEDAEKGIHFFIDDYQFERLWNSPKTYIQKMIDKGFKFVLTPDFSLYLDMPVALKIWNVFRSRLIGQLCQDYGLSVVPTIVWAEPESYEYVFDGLPKHGTIAVSTVGIMETEASRNIFKDGMQRALKELEPKLVLCYGARIDFDWGETEVKFYDARSWQRGEE